MALSSLFRQCTMHLRTFVGLLPAVVGVRVMVRARVRASVRVRVLACGCVGVSAGVGPGFDALGVAGDRSSLRVAGVGSRLRVSFRFRVGVRVISTVVAIADGVAVVIVRVSSGCGSGDQARGSVETRAGGGAGFRLVLSVGASFGVRGSAAGPLPVLWAGARASISSRVQCVAWAPVTIIFVSTKE
jgi:hypothetical protein